MANRQVVTGDGIELELSNLDKQFWPHEGITKADLIAYYAAIGTPT